MPCTYLTRSRSSRRLKSSLSVSALKSSLFSYFAVSRSKLKASAAAISWESVLLFFNSIQCQYLACKLIPSGFTWSAGFSIRKAMLFAPKATCSEGHRSVPSPLRPSLQQCQARPLRFARPQSLARFLGPARRSPDAQSAVAQVAVINQVLVAPTGSILERVP